MPRPTADERLLRHCRPLERTGQPPALLAGPVAHSLDAPFVSIALGDRSRRACGHAVKDLRSAGRGGKETAKATGTRAISVHRAIGLRSDAHGVSDPRPYRGLVG